MQNTFKIGDKIKVVKFTHSFPRRYKKFIDQEFYVIEVGGKGVSIEDPDKFTSFIFFYNEEIELVKDEPLPQEVVSTPKKNHAWAVVDKSTGKVKWIRQTRSVARKLVKIWEESSKGGYQVKKIEYNFV